MPPVGFEPTISAGERPKTYALDRAATGTGNNIFYKSKFCYYCDRYERQVAVIVENNVIMDWSLDSGCGR